MNLDRKTNEIKKVMETYLECDNLSLKESRKKRKATDKLTSSGHFKSSLPDEGKVIFGRCRILEKDIESLFSGIASILDE